MATIEKIKKGVDRALNDREKEVDDLQAKIKEMENNSATAEAAMSAATDASDPAAYSKAKADMTAANDAIEMYTDKVNRLLNTPLVNTEEYQAYCDEILAEVNNVTEAAKGTLKELSDQMKKCGDNLAATVKAADGLLGTLYSDLMLKSEKRVKVPSSVNKVIDWSKTPLGDIYMQMTGYRPGRDPGAINFAAVIEKHNAEAAQRRQDQRRQDQQGNPEENDAAGDDTEAADDDNSGGEVADNDNA